MPWKDRLEERSTLFQFVISYWVFIFLFGLLVAPPKEQNLSIILANSTLENVRLDGIPSDVFGVLYLLLEVVFGLVGYDFVYYWVHLLSHLRPLCRYVLPRILIRSSDHARHHEESSGTLGSRHTLYHSTMEGTLQFLSSVLVQRYNYFTLLVPWIQSTTVKTRFARLLHNVLIVWLLTESHADSKDARGKRKFVRYFPSIFPGVVHHRLHHSGQEPWRLQQFFSYLDQTISKACSARGWLVRESSTRG